MSDIIEYKCPRCGAAISFDSTSQRLVCGYCGCDFDAEELDNFKQEYENSVPVDKGGWQVNSEAWTAAEAANLVTYNCSSCGGQVVTDKTTATAQCPYCNSHMIVMSHFAGGMRPDYRIPFKLDYQAAMEGFKNHLKDKRLLPDKFYEEQQLREAKCVYVPHWIFDADVEADVVFDPVHSVTVTVCGKTTCHRKHYSAPRSVAISFRGVPVDSSSKIGNEMTESLEPYDLNELKPFHPAYLSGYLADKFDTDSENCRRRAQERIEATVMSVLGKTVSGGYSVLEVLQKDIRLKNNGIKYVMYPVWLLNVEWQNKIYTFGMNGQTGQFVGDLPVDREKKMRWFKLLTAVFGVGSFVIFLAAWFLFGILMVAGSMGGFVAVHVMSKKMQSVKKQFTAADYIIGNPVVVKGEDKFLYKESKPVTSDSISQAISELSSRAEGNAAGAEDTWQSSGSERIDSGFDNENRL